MLKSHLDVCEKVILAKSGIVKNAGHTLHKGTPREIFIKEFLEDHLSESLAIGTGEIIDYNSKPGDPRNQIDIVLYKRNYPKIHFGGGIYGFLVESVVATIEIKSVLDEKAMKQSMGAAKNVKALKMKHKGVFMKTAAYRAPSILNFLVAYDGPASMRTVYGWVNGIHAELGITNPQMPSDPKLRSRVIAPSLDGIFFLGQGFMLYDNSAICFGGDEPRLKNPAINWTVVDESLGNLLVLFLLLTFASNNNDRGDLDPMAYLSEFEFEKGFHGP